MDTLPLLPRPALEQYRERAEALVAAANSGNPDAVHQWADEWLTRLTQRLAISVTPFVQHSFNRAMANLEEEARSRVAAARERGAEFALVDAQQLVARAHSYDTWTQFADEIDGLRQHAPTSEFERAADAIVDGDLATLEHLLTRHPGLVRARSARTHHATLLHYVAANGVEDFRQRTPPNAVAIATRLLEAGAEVDALADTYGGGTAQTTMNLLVSSAHPAERGLQSALADVLLDHGATIDGLDGNGSPILTALAFGYRDAAETLARRGARIANVVTAAALGRLDLVREWVVDARTLTNHAPYREGPYWVHIPDDATGQIEMALVWACKFGRTEVARWLLDRGVDPAAADHDRMTALHWAAAGGLLDIMDLLLTARAPLEVRNVWGGTVLDSTVYFAMHQPIAGADYPRVIDRLLEAGADLRALEPSPTGIAAIDAVIQRYRG